MKAQLRKQDSKRMELLFSPGGTSVRSGGGGCGVGTRVILEILDDKRKKSPDVTVAKRRRRGRTVLASISTPEMFYLFLNCNTNKQNPDILKKTNLFHAIHELEQVALHSEWCECERRLLRAPS